MADGPAAGWYPDPEDSTQQRYWDGQQWTEHRAPLAGQPSGQQPWSDQQQWSGQQPWGQAPAHGGAGGQGQNTKALWSMILGILGLVCCGLFAGIPAMILGSQAKQEIEMSGGAQSGAGMAQAGFIMGIISIVLTVIGVAVWAVGFGLAGTGGSF